MRREIHIKANRGLETSGDANGEDVEQLGERQPPLAWIEPTGPRLIREIVLVRPLLRRVADVDVAD